MPTKKDRLWICIRALMLAENTLVIYSDKHPELVEDLRGIIRKLDLEMSRLDGFDV